MRFDDFRYGPYTARVDTRTARGAPKAAPRHPRGGSGESKDAPRSFQKMPRDDQGSSRDTSKSFIGFQRRPSGRISLLWKMLKKRYFSNTIAASAPSERTRAVSGEHFGRSRGFRDILCGFLAASRGLSKTSRVALGDTLGVQAPSETLRCPPRLCWESPECKK